MPRANRIFVSLFLAVLFLALPMSVRDAAARKGKTPPVDSGSTPAWVTLDGVQLFQISDSVGSFQASERAAAINQRLAAILKLEDFDPENFTVKVDPAGTVILYESRIFAVLTNQDAEAAHSTLTDFAQASLASLRTATSKEQQAYRLRDQILPYVKALLATLIFLLLGGFWNKLRNWIVLRFLKPIKSDNAGSFLRRWLLLNRWNLLRYARFLAQALYVLGLVIGLYAYAAFVFNLFPATQPYTDRLVHLALNPLLTIARSFGNYLPNLFLILTIVLVTYWITKATRYFFDEVESERIRLEGFYPDWAPTTSKLVQFLLFIFAAILIFPYLPGSDSLAFKGISVFLAALLSLGSTSAVGNVLAGIQITYMRPFKLGDRVKVGDTIGDVIEKSLLVTRIRTLKNLEVTIPNSAILGNQIVNFTSAAENTGIILHTTVTLGYDIPWPKAHSLLKEAALETKGLLSDPPPFVLQTALNDYTISYELNAYTKEDHQMPALYSRLHEAIQNSFQKAGVEILSPAYTAYRDGNPSTIPSTSPPGFSSAKESKP